MKITGQCLLGLWATLLVAATGLTAQTTDADSFSNASVIGTYSANERGDGSVSAGLGLVRYDGKGGTSRRITVNAPAEGGGRRLLVFEANGNYTVNNDGTGTITYVNTISGGMTSSVTFDFVITSTDIVWIPSVGRRRVATELTAVQREAGLTVSLITSVQKRIADE